MLFGLHLSTPHCVLPLTGDLTLQLMAVVPQILSEIISSSGEDPELLCVGCLQLGMGALQEEES